MLIFDPADAIYNMNPTNDFADWPICSASGVAQTRRRLTAGGRDVRCRIFASSGPAIARFIDIFRAIRSVPSLETTSILGGRNVFSETHLFNESAEVGAKAQTF